MEWHGGSPLPCAKFHVYVGNVSSLRGEKPIFGPLSKSSACQYLYNKCIVISDMWCGVVDNCVVRENNSVTFGCYVQYDWLSYLIQYNPIVRLNSSLHFVEDPSTRDSKKPQVNFGVFGHPSEELRTTYTVPNVQPGQTLTAECRTDLTFDLTTGYSGRNTYAPNSLSHSCFVNRTVHCKYFRFVSLRLLLSFAFTYGASLQALHF